MGVGLGVQEALGLDRKGIPPPEIVQASVPPLSLEPPPQLRPPLEAFHSWLKRGRPHDLDQKREPRMLGRQAVPESRLDSPLYW